MKSFGYIFLLVFSFLFCLVQYAVAQDNFELILNEEFNDTVLNRELWQTKYTWGRTISSNHELEYYTDRGNIKIDSGILQLIARRENITAKIDSTLADTFAFPNRQNLSSYNYTSGMLCSKQEFKYGKFEIHCRMPKGAGMWPAFWLYGGWPADEIDIMEYRGEWQKRASCGVHSYDSTKYRRSGKWTKFASKNFSRQFHTFTCYWYPDVIIFEVDGKETFRFSTPYPNQYKRPERLIVNLAVGSGLAFSGPPKEKDVFPKSFEVDYIKVWRLKQ